MTNNRVLRLVYNADDIIFAYNFIVMENKFDKKVRIVLIDDHKLLRSGLKTLFEAHPELVVVSESDSGREGIEKVRMQNPDVVVLDLGLDDISGVEVAKTIVENNPKSKIVVLTSQNNPQIALELIKMGINAYVMKDVKDEILVAIIKSVSENAMWLDGAIVDYIRKNPSGIIPNKTYSRAGFKASHANLTEREYEVLKLIVDGKSNSQIADILSISEHTSKAHVCNIIQKLVVDDRTQAAVKAIKEGLV